MSAAQSLRLINGTGGPESLTDAFHRINNVLPEDQQLVTLAPDATVGEALEVMNRHGFSQIPVLAGDHVLGVFSYRSFANRIVDFEDANVSYEQLPVDEFLEQLDFVHVGDDLKATFDALDRDNSLLVGAQDRIQGILTPMDVLRYLYDVASPFVLIAEIELSLRKIIRACVDEDQLQECIENSLSQHYDDLPSRLEEMTFNDYVQIIGDGRNWKYFHPVLGTDADFHRKMTRAKLEEIGDLRNVAFHFKRAITSRENRSLRTHREWLLMKVKSFTARTTEGSHE